MSGEMEEAEQTAEVFEIYIPITVCLVSEEEESFSSGEEDAVHENVIAFGNVTSTTCAPDISATVCQKLAEESTDLMSEEDISSTDPDALKSVKKAGCKVGVTEKFCNLRPYSVSEDNLPTSKESDHFQSISDLLANDASCSHSEDLPETLSHGLELETEECPPLPSAISRNKTALQEKPDAGYSAGEKVKQAVRQSKLMRENIKSTSTDSSCQDIEVEVGLLNIQTNSEHSLVKEHKCDLCYRSYTSLRHLKVHRKTHKKSPSLKNGRQRNKPVLKKNHLDKSEGQATFTELEAGQSPKKTITTFSCKVCPFSSQCIKQFLTHMKGHWVSKPYHCSQCDFSISSLSKIKTHMYGHVGEELYRCPLCSYKSKYQNNLERHLWVHSVKKSFLCKLCNSAFKNPYMLKKHMFSHNGCVSIHKCDQCFLFLSEEHLFYHKQAHLAVKIETPAIEGNANLQHHHSSKQYKCDQCEYKSYAFSNLKKHIRMHTGEKPFPCNKCEKTFHTSSHLVRHESTHCMQRLHKGEKGSCSGRSTEDLKVHQDNHQGASSSAVELVPLEASRCGECEASLPSSQPLGERVDQDRAENESSPPPEGISPKSSNSLHNHIENSSKLHKCNQCDYVAYSSSNFKQHVQIHTVEKPYKCNQCEKAFCTGSHLNRQKAGHLKPNLHNCENCGYTGRTAEDLEVHQHSHHGGSFSAAESIPLEASRHGECDASLATSQPLGENVDYHDKVENESSHPPEAVSPKNSNSLHNHIENSRKLHMCYQCEYVTYNSSNFKQHVRIHSGEKPYKCNQCEKAFRTGSHLNRHNAGHLKQELHNCGYTGRSPKDLEVHKKTHQGDAANGAKCYTLLSSSQHPEEPSSQHPAEPSSQHPGEHVDHQPGLHIRNTSPEGASPKVFKCDLCSYTAHVVGYLMMHMRAHTIDNLYTCELCSKRFQTSSHLLQHKKVHKNMVDSLKCDLCDYATSSFKFLQMHKLVHSEKRKASASEMPIKLHMCTKCNYSTVNSWNFKLHSRIHTGEKPHKCDKCSLAFRTSSHLKRHMVTHMTAKCYQCEKCTYSAKRSDALKKHLATHKAEKSIGVNTVT